MIHRVNLIWKKLIACTQDFKFAEWDTQSLLLVLSYYGDTLLNLVYTQLTDILYSYTSITIFVFSGEFQWV